MKTTIPSQIKMAALIAGLSLSVAQPTFAFFGSSKNKDRQVDQTPAASLGVLNAPESQSQEQAAQQVLLTMAQEMTSTLNQIDSLLKAEQPGQALALAKNTLDTVRVKTGIDPKAKLQQKFYVPALFPTSSKDMTTLPEGVKEAVITTVRDFRGGLYLDIMNLSKRTTLLYIKALHAQIKKDGGLTTEDRNKIIKDLAAASLVPLYIVDKNGVKIVAFDEDVANEDHTYMFNREIKMYLLNAKDLQMSEASFEKYKTEYKTYLGGNSSAPKFGSVSESCVQGMSVIITGFSSNAGVSNVEKFIQLCSSDRALESRFSCIQQYNIAATGFSSNSGWSVFNKAYENCK